MLTILMILAVYSVSVSGTAAVKKLFKTSGFITVSVSWAIVVASLLIMHKTGFQEATPEISAGSIVLVWVTNASIWQLEKLKQAWFFIVDLIKKAKEAR